MDANSPVVIIDEEFSFESSETMNKRESMNLETVFDRSISLHIDQVIDSDSDYRSLTPSSVVDHKYLNDSDVTPGNPEDILEPEAEIIESFRKFGVRFISDASTYRHCDCEIPTNLLQWQYNMSEVAEQSGTAIPLSFQFRWAEIKQNFKDGDIFGDLQFQDFLLSREKRGPFHAMIHFAGIYANVGYDGFYWYWVLTGDPTMPFVEDKLRKKGDFLISLRAMIKEQFDETIETCPEPLINSHLYVRAALDDQCRLPDEEDSTDSIEDLWPTREQDSIDGKKQPKRLFYADLYCEGYFSRLHNY